MDLGRRASLEDLATGFAFPERALQDDDMTEAFSKTCNRPRKKRPSVLCSATAKISFKTI